MLNQTIEAFFFFFILENNSEFSFVSFKDNDIMEANVSLGELQQKIKRLEGLCQVSASNLYNEVNKPTYSRNKTVH